VPAARVATIAEVAGDEKMWKRGFIVEVEHPVAGPVPMQGLPIRLSDTPTAIRIAAPVLGAHNAEVANDWLGVPLETVTSRRA
jgi:crotonobetainyl-CoA:carnitine CoA-transferase CaiB-like acyl-CoA transferase